ncbi:MAG TPA: alpha/beta fold hydrolase [Sphingomicrobium sp.]|nr:alpha/beta fold hydrolase [Sphingomicrobium sp.]
MVRQLSGRDPALARAALSGLEAYEKAARPPTRPQRPAVARVAGASIRDHGGDGAPVVLVPSLINPPHVLDLDEETSLAAALGKDGRQVLLVDWGRANDRSNLSIAEHVEGLLLPLLDAIGEPARLIGYCLGGTMAIAAAQLAPVHSLATLAAPWHFKRYPEASRAALARLWEQSESASAQLGALPMEVLQAGFWALDPERTVKKYSEFSGLDPASDRARRFIMLEDWANDGEPLPLPAARELFESLYRDDAPGSGNWTVGGKAISERPPVRTIHVVAGEDRIVPPESAPEGEQVVIASGHVGMVVGRARTQLHQALSAFLAS